MEKWIEIPFKNTSMEDHIGDIGTDGNILMKWGMWV
jgi:hypothetical protein